MAAPSYLVTNEIDSSATITVSTEDTVYVKENLYDGILAKPFRFTVTIEPFSMSRLVTWWPRCLEISVVADNTKRFFSTSIADGAECP